MKLILGTVGQHRTVTECARAGTRDTGCGHYRFQGGESLEYHKDRVWGTLGKEREFQAEKAS